MTRAAMTLGGFAVLGALLVGLTFEGTKDRIAANEREFLLRSLHAMITPSAHDNDLLEDVIRAQSKDLLGAKEPVTIYRARKNGKPVAAIITAYAPDGYSGAIKLLVAVDYSGQIGGVRVLSHKETPGLGDKIEVEKSGWINSFYGHSLNAPDEQGWRVKKDGGIFDQFTGATITPRAVVKAVHKALKYYKMHKDEMFAANAAEIVIHDW
ncbi:MAG TPA: electron transport complex subunit RsxG [Candidatus Tenderia sp.]|nr:electron transport complex subunit RsxG [Candidatus Tenderia sp.]